MTFEYETKELIRRLDTMAANDIRDEVVLCACAKRLKDQSALIESYEGVMRELASWLGAGGYNSTDATPQAFSEKIRWGVDHIVCAESKSRDDVIEQQAKEIETLNSVSKKMARTGMQIRNDLAEAKLKNIEQAKQIEALRTGDTCGRSCEGQAYRIEARTLKAEIEQANLLIEQQAKRIAELERLNLTFAQNEQQVEALRGFAQDIMECWPDCSGLDGGDLQDIAETHGLLKPEQRSVPCGPDCNCAQITDLMPVTCYRKTKLLTGQ